MSLLGIDSSTARSAACVLRADGEAFEVVPDPGALSDPPAHARELMPAVADVMERSGLAYGDLTAIAVGVGPGTFTGLRIGVATARALAAAAGLPLRPVSSLAALAAGIGAQHPATAALAVIDARRGEVFAALYGPAGERLWGPVAAPPGEVAEHVRGCAVAARAAGDGSIRFRGVLEAAGIGVEADESHSHVVRALEICRLAAAAPDEAPDAVLPEYLRAPDAKPQ